MCHSTIIGFNHQGIGRGVMGSFDLGEGDTDTEIQHLEFFNHDS